MDTRRRITLEEFQAELGAQAVPREDLAFVCPMCRTVQSARSLIAAGVGATFEDVDGQLAFSCVGRFTNAGPPISGKAPGGGCNWTLGGLLRLHQLEVEVPDGPPQPTFAPASPEEAQALKAQHDAGAAKERA
jgi:hypothetical protein